MRLGSFGRRSSALALTLALLAGSLASLAQPAPAAAALPAWTGGINLFRSGAFTTQYTWRWCTAADVQLIRNIVDHQQDHSRDSQLRYYTYMRNHNRYPIPPKDGVDPAGWAAGLRHYVDSRYHVVASATFASALRSAVRNLRLTQRPVGLLVAHGDHAWVLTGFTATADPAVTSRFTVTSVRVTGPLWGLQSRTYGYDMHPNKLLTTTQLRDFLTPWHYAGIRMSWEGAFVTIQPIPSATTAAATTAARAVPALAPITAPVDATAAAQALPMSGAGRRLAVRRARPAAGRA
jgi:hypothetical protein